MKAFDPAPILTILVEELRESLRHARKREDAERESREKERAEFRRIISELSTAQSIAAAGISPGIIVPDGPPPKLGTGLDASNRPVPSIVGMLPRENGSFNLEEPPERSDFDGELSNFDTSRHGSDVRFTNGHRP